MSMHGKTILQDRYELGGLIAHGGMADVFEALDLQLGRTVAVKVLRSDLARDAVFLSRFRREAIASAGLNHPRIVAVFDTGEREVPQPHGPALNVPYMVMELIHGKTLRQELDAGPMDPLTAVDTTLGVLEALEYSHASGIVHRDIKPGNVMITEHGSVKVMDFGIARALADSQATMTQTRAVLGTAQYLSPEQAKGEQVDERSDLYSTACVLYELLTGRPPFTGESAVSMAYQHVRETPDPPSAHNPLVTAELDAVVLHGLAKARGERYQNATEFRRDLSDAVLGLDPTHAGGAGPDNSAAAALPEPGEAGSPTGRIPVVDPSPAERAVPVSTGGSSVARFQELSEEFDDPDHRPLRVRRRWFALVWALVAGVVVVGGVLGWGFINTPPQVERVGVPQVVGFSADKAHAALLNRGLETQDTVLEFHDTIEKGKITRTVPAAGQQVPLGAQVQLYQSNGPSQLTVPPDLVGKTETHVREMLRNAGFSTVAESTVGRSATVPAGSVVSVAPESGKKVPAESKFALVISDGKVEIPDVTGKTAADAENLLRGDGLKLPVILSYQARSDTNDGLVLAQSLTGLQPQGSTVELTVSRYVPPAVVQTVPQPPPALVPAEPAPEEQVAPPEVATGQPTSEPAVTEAPPTTEAPVPTVQPQPTNPEPTGQPEPTDQPQPTNPEPTATPPTGPAPTTPVAPAPEPTGTGRR